MISVNEYKNIKCKTIEIKDAKTIKFLIYVDCQNKTVSSMMTKEVLNKSTTC